jgi:hypothetical protein
MLGLLAVRLLAVLLNLIVPRMLLHVARLVDVLLGSMDNGG